MIVECKNCNHKYKGTHCNYCGQLATTDRLNRHAVWHDIQHGFLHFDRGIFFTVKEMFTRPGHSIREYIEGKRVKHFKPISFVLLIAGVYGYLDHTFDISLNKMQAQIEREVRKPRKDNFEPLKIIDWITNHYALFTLGILLFVALASKWAFKKIGYNYIENLILNAFLSGQHIIIQLLCAPPIVFIVKNNPKLDDLNLIPTVIGIGTTFWVYFQFYNKLSKKERLWRTVLSYVYFLLLFASFLILVIVVSALYIVWKKYH
jgi:hypothetical protein